MKLLLCTLEYPPQIGGVANYYDNLLRAWPKDDTWSVLDNSQGELLANKGFLPWSKAFFSLLRKIKEQKPNLVFLGQILPLGTVALILNIFKKFDFAVFLHGMDLSFALRLPRKRFLTRLILKKAKTIVCANSYVRQILLDFLPELEGKLILINPGVSAGKAQTKIKEGVSQRYKLNGKKVIFSIGRLVKRKGFDQVIKALAQLKLDNWYYLLAGSGPEEDALRSLAADSSVKDKIVFLGRLSEEEKWSYLDLCDIFIMTPLNLDGDFEGFGIVYLEANLMAKPVIASDSGGVKDAVINNETGLLLNPEKQEEITEAIEKLLSQAAEAKRLGLNGQKRAINDFSWTGQAYKLYQYLH